MQKHEPVNWASSAVKLALLDAEEVYHAAGRDSRIVRASFIYSTQKKRFLTACKQILYRFTKRQKISPVLRVFFWLPGGVGDAACARRLVSTYRTLLPGAQFEIFCPVLGAAQTVFEGLENVSFATDVKRYWKDYDLVVCACLAAKFLYVNDKRFQTLAPDFIPVLRRAQDAQAQLGVLLEDPFLTEDILGRLMRSIGARRFDLLSYTAGVPLEHDTKERLGFHKNILGKYQLAGKEYITFHDGNLGEDATSTRMWPKQSWRLLLQQIKRQFPQVTLVQLGAPGSYFYDEADVCLVGQTQLTELPSLLFGARLHVDSESGLVHLAQYTFVPSIVLYGPSDKEFFAYSRNTNLSAGDCGGCMWSVPGWMHACPLGHKPAKCMQAISVESVWEAVREKLTTH